MIFIIIGYVTITVGAISLCVFSGKQQRNEDEYLIRRQGQATPEELERMRIERADWDLLNDWGDDNVT